MAYANPTYVMDQALNAIRSGALWINICDALPTTAEEAYSTHMLMRHAVTSADFELPVDGVGGDRILEVHGHYNVTVTNTGTGIYTALFNYSGSILYYVTACVSIGLVATEVAHIAGFYITLGAPA
jgi:hypothetical protein